MVVTVAGEEDVRVQTLQDFADMPEFVGWVVKVLAIPRSWATSHDTTRERLMEAVRFYQDEILLNPVINLYGLSDPLWLEQLKKDCDAWKGINLTCGIVKPGK